MRKVRPLKVVGGILVSVVSGVTVAFVVQALNDVHHSPPLGVDIEPSPSDSVVIPRAPSALPTPPSERSPTYCEDWRRWADALGARDAETTTAHVLLTGRSDEAVVLEGARVRVVKRAPAVSGSWSNARCVSRAVVPRVLQVDLDRDPPTIGYLTRASAPQPVPELSVAKGDVEDLEIVATTHRCACAWFVELTAIEAGKPHTIRLDNHGRPFETVGRQAAQRVHWADGKWQPGSA